MARRKKASEKGQLIGAPQISVVVSGVPFDTFKEDFRGYAKSAKDESAIEKAVTSSVIRAAYVLCKDGLDGESFATVRKTGDKTSVVLSCLAGSQSFAVEYTPADNRAKLYPGMQDFAYYSVRNPICYPDLDYNKLVCAGDKVRIVDWSEIKHQPHIFEVSDTPRERERVMQKELKFLESGEY